MMTDNDMIWLVSFAYKLAADTCVIVCRAASGFEASIHAPTSQSLLKPRSINSLVVDVKG
jgi:hypothetical protein